jgi:hypothetical protein
MIGDTPQQLIINGGIKGPACFLGGMAQPIGQQALQLVVGADLLQTSVGSG